MILEKNGENLMDGEENKCINMRANRKFPVPENEVTNKAQSDDGRAIALMPAISDSKRSTARPRAR